MARNLPKPDFVHGEIFGFKLEQNDAIPPNAMLMGTSDAVYVLRDLGASQDYIERVTDDLIRFGRPRF